MQPDPHLLSDQEIPIHTSPLDSHSDRFQHMVLQPANQVPFKGLPNLKLCILAHFAYRPVNQNLWQGLTLLRNVSPSYQGTHKEGQRVPLQ